MFYHNEIGDEIFFCIPTVRMVLVKDPLLMISRHIIILKIKHCLWVISRTLKESVGISGILCLGSPLRMLVLVWKSGACSQISTGRKTSHPPYSHPRWSAELTSHWNTANQNLSVCSQQGYKIWEPEMRIAYPGQNWGDISPKLWVCFLIFQITSLEQPVFTLIKFIFLDPVLFLNDVLCVSCLLLHYNYAET